MVAAAVQHSEQYMCMYDGNIVQWMMVLSSKPAAAAAAAMNCPFSGCAASVVAAPTVHWLQCCNTKAATANEPIVATMTFLPSSSLLLPPPPSALLPPSRPNPLGSVEDGGGGGGGVGVKKPIKTPLAISDSRLNQW